MTDRRYIGKRNKRNGAIFENILSHACRYYLEEGIAHIEKTPEPFHILKKEGNVVTGYFEKKGQPDYKGVLCDGTGIMFEAKHTDGDKIMQKVVTQSQWENLDIYERFGAKCFVMVSMDFNNYYRVPWDIWKRMKELFKHKYMSKEELEPYRLKEIPRAVLILDGIELRD